MADSTDTASKAQKRVIVSLPAEIASGLDTLGAAMSAAVLASSDMEVEFSPAQVVQSLVKSALKAQEARETASKK